MFRGMHCNTIFALLAIDRLKEVDWDVTKVE